MQKKTKRKLNKFKKKVIGYFWISSLLVVLLLSAVAIGKYHYAETTIIEVEKIVPITTEKPEETIKRVLEEEGIEWLKVFRIIECESRWNVYFKEKMKDGSYDRGLYAFNTYHYKEVSDECAFNVECATREFIKSYKNNKLNDWLCARSLGIK